MTRLEFCESGYAAHGMELGFVSEAKFAQYIRFRVFCDFVQQGYDKATSVLYAADRLGCEESTIYRAISFMNEPVFSQEPAREIQR